jgi:hypothetical protein
MLSPVVWTSNFDPLVSMDPISNANPALDAIRRELTDNIERLRKSGALGGGSRAASARQPAAAQIEGLESILRRKISALDRRSTEGKAKATLAFVEAVLVAEFGDTLLADAGLGALLSDISASLREDPRLRDLLDEVFAKL